MTIHYQISPADRHGHYFDVQLSIDEPAKRQQLRLPAWLPGSYMIRDFAKHVGQFSVADQQGKAIAWQQVDKQTWLIEDAGAPIVVSYRVYAWDLSVRTAYLDQYFGFFNPSALCLEVVGQAEQQQRVKLVRPQPIEADSWRVITGMPVVNVDQFGFGEYQAANYAELIDYPALLGDLTVAEFAVAGCQHRIALAGKHYADLSRITKDLEKICAAQIDLFGGQAPFSEYSFLVMVVGNGFGGLEHRNSTALLCSRKDLIAANQAASTESYRTFLSLCSHEYFHSWNVKRLRPKAFVPYQLAQEQYTEQLWFYEGVTSYYDDLFLQRTGLATAEQYLTTLAATYSRAFAGPGVERQPLKLSSKLAWTTFYQQNENALNAISSYYSKGAIVALCLDLLIRQDSAHEYSLDNVMQKLWHDHGVTEQGTSDDNLAQALIDSMQTSAGKQRMEGFLHLALTTTDPLPVAELLADVGISMTLQCPETDNGPWGKAARLSLPVALGARYRGTEHGLEITAVIEQGAAWHAGIAAGDRLIAMDHLALTGNNYVEHFHRYQSGDRVSVHGFRRDELYATELTWQQPAAKNAVLSVTNPALAAPWLQLAGESPGTSN